jgi:hypothetical protein
MLFSAPLFLLLLLLIQNGHGSLIVKYGTHVVAEGEELMPAQTQRPPTVQYPDAEEVSIGVTHLYSIIQLRIDWVINGQGSAGI